LDSYIFKGDCYIHSLKQGESNVLAEATILEKVGDNQYLAEFNGVKCTAIFNPFVCRYYVDDKYGVIEKRTHERGGREER